MEKRKNHKAKVNEGFNDCLLTLDSRLVENFPSSLSSNIKYESGEFILLTLQSMYSALGLNPIGYYPTSVLFISVNIEWGLGGFWLCQLSYSNSVVKTTLIVQYLRYIVLLLYRILYCDEEKEKKTVDSRESTRQTWLNRGWGLPKPGVVDVDDACRSGPRISLYSPLFLSS